MTDRTTRRNLVIAGGLGLVAAAAMPAAPAAAKSMTDAEKANVALMKAFFADFGAVDLDVDKFTEKYFAPNCLVRWLVDEMPPVIGPKQAALQLKPFFTKGSSLPIKIVDMFAKGPVVSTSRIDTMKAPGKPDEVFNVAGVHVIKDGKLVEYSDWVIR